MNQDTVINLATQAMMLALKIAGPMLLAGLIVGLLVSIFQAVTSIQEQSLSFIPKIVAVAVLIVVLGPWMLNQLISYAQNLYMSIPSLIG
jgi:flagellar biosynthesis protein FliQ